MFSVINIITIAAIWFKKATSLPKLYHGTSNKKGIPVSTLRAFEKPGRKQVKLGLDVKYFQSCLDLKLCPEFLKFKPPNLSVYRNGKDLYQVVVSKKLKEINKNKRVTEIRFNNLKKYTLTKLSFWEKTCIISLLEKEFQRIGTPHIMTHEKILRILLKKQAERRPDCIANYNKKD